MKLRWICVLRELGLEGWYILDVCLDAGSFSPFPPMVTCHFLCVCVSEILCDVCTSEEREYSPCDYSSQLADFRWPIMKENLNEQFICTWKWRLYW